MAGKAPSPRATELYHATGSIASSLGQPFTPHSANVHGCTIQPAFSTAFLKLDSRRALDPPHRGSFADPAQVPAL